MAEDFFGVECAHLRRKLLGKNASTGGVLANRTNRISALAVERTCEAAPAMRHFLETALAFTGMFNVGMRDEGICDACALPGAKLRLVRFVSCEAHPHLAAREFAVRTDVLQMTRWLHFYKHFTNWLTLKIAEGEAFDMTEARRVFDFAETRVSTLTI